jgi:hypothetical protein
MRTILDSPGDSVSTPMGTSCHSPVDGGGGHSHRKQLAQCGLGDEHSHGSQLAKGGKHSHGNHLE